MSLDALFLREMERGRLRALRVFVFGLLGLDCLVLMTAHSWRAGAGNWNLAHVSVLDLLPVPDAGVHAAIYLTCGFLALAVAAGAAGRRAVATLTVLYGYAYFSSRSDGYQHHYLIAWLLLLCCAVPWGTKSERVRSWGIGLLYAQISIVYLFTAITKLDHWWLNGWALQRQIQRDGLRELLAATGTLTGLSEASVYSLLAWSVMLWQASVAPAFLWPRLRPWACATGPLFHGMVEVVGLEIRWFSWYMIALYYLLLFPERWYAALARPIARRLPTWPEPPGWPRWTLVPLAVAAGLAVSTTDFPRPLVAAGLVAGSVLLWRRSSGWVVGGTLVAAVATAQVPRHTDAAYDFYRFQGGDAVARKDDALAVQAYAAAVAVRPGADSRHRKLAEALERLDRRDEACALFGRALALRPGDRRAAEGSRRCQDDD